MSWSEPAERVIVQSKRVVTKTGLNVYDCVHKIYLISFNDGTSVNVYRARVCHEEDRYHYLAEFGDGDGFGSDALRKIADFIDECDSTLKKKG